MIENFSKISDKPRQKHKSIKKVLKSSKINFMVKKSINTYFYTYSGSQLRSLPHNNFTITNPYSPYPIKT